MQVGIVTVNGQKVGVVTFNPDARDGFVPDLSGSEPQGRASETPRGLGAGRGDAPLPEIRQRSPKQRTHHGAPQRHGEGKASPSGKHYAPAGQHYAPSQGHPFDQGSSDTDRAILEASKAHGLDPNTMRGIASIESGMNPGSNANRSTQYKGLYQVGHEEWNRFGQGNIYSAKDNANATARMFDANRSQFKSHFGREPTDTELYLMHQQGLGFYTRGAMTNIKGNPYPGMRGAQTHESFEAGWGRELARRKASFANKDIAAKPVDKPFDPGTDAL